MSKITLNSDTTYPAGADLGNGFVNLWLADRHAGTPAGYMLEQPQGEWNAKTQTFKAPQAQEITVNGRAVWVGRDALTPKMIRLLDDTKYDKEHLRTLFSAGLAEWLRTTKATTDATLRLRVVCGMPAGKFNDAKARATAEKAYKAAFSVRQSDQWRMTVGSQQVRLLTQFVGLRPETVGYSSLHRLDAGYTVVVDCGAGTVDIAVFHSSQPSTPIAVQSFNIGLTHAFDGIQAVQLDLPELLLIRRQLDAAALDAYVAQIKTLVQKFCRKLEDKGEPIKVKMIGGLPHLMSKEQRQAFGLGASVVFGDASENARAFAGYAAN